MDLRLAMVSINFIFFISQWRDISANRKSQTEGLAESNWFRTPHRWWKLCHTWSISVPSCFTNRQWLLWWIAHSQQLGPNCGTLCVRQQPSSVSFANLIIWRQGLNLRKSSIPQCSTWKDDYSCWKRVQRSRRVYTKSSASDCERKIQK